MYSLILNLNFSYIQMKKSELNETVPQFYLNHESDKFNYTNI